MIQRAVVPRIDGVMAGTRRRCCFFAAARKIHTASLAILPLPTRHFCFRRLSINSSTEVPRTETDCPAFTPSFSTTDLGFAIFLRHFSACGPSRKTARPSFVRRCSSPSLAVMAVMEPSAIFSRVSPRKSSSLVSSKAFPQKDLPSWISVQVSSLPIGPHRLFVEREPQETEWKGYFKKGLLSFSWPMVVLAPCPG